MCYGGRSQPKCGLLPQFQADNPRLWIAPQDWQIRNTCQSCRHSTPRLPDCAQNRLTIMIWIIRGCHWWHRSWWWCWRGVSFAELTPRTVRDSCAFCKCSGRGTRPLPRLAPVPRPHVISGNRNSFSFYSHKNAVQLKTERRLFLMINCRRECVDTLTQQSKRHIQLKR